ncbi:13675_t:CDS:2 [Acaulospora morrowiae]|uniref:20S-pre-rRNA D-site endonuclease NOB1 n=1 Tax=Acaulospora morrowiae TaxID=94023 RepID=A0A9N8Z9C7_9GLOM|nr:13675_t:CDS:2 [Acaulospora morrowiae]
MVTNEQRHKFKCLVVDSGPLIKGANIRPLAEKIYTVPEVISEIRDKHSRDFLSQISFEIEVKNPTQDALKEVVNFSKKSGDYANLSAVDLRVLALTYMLEVEANGTKRLQKEPLKFCVRQGGNHDSTKIARENEDNDCKSHKDANVHDITTNLGSLILSENTIENENKSIRDNISVTDNFTDLTNKFEDDFKNNEISKTLTKNEITTKSSVGVNIRASPNDDFVQDPHQLEQEKTSGENGTTSSQDEDVPESPDNQSSPDHYSGESDDADDWITPDNIKSYQEKDQNLTIKSNRNSIYIKVACMTTDYTIQNVLLQMHLNLVSVEGLRINKVKNWVLRITANMEKQFCPTCGNATLIRTSTSTDANGKVTYYLKKNFQYNLRGTKYSIPEPKGGRHANNIILREDQKEYQRALKQHRKKKEVDIFDPDYVPQLMIGSTFSMSSGPPVIGYGRRNPNESRRGKGKRKKRR